MDEAIDLTVPTLAELMALVRFTAATLASPRPVLDGRDRRPPTGSRRVVPLGDRAVKNRADELHFTREHDTIEISCTVDAPVVATTDEDDAEHEWSLRILDALVAEHGQESAGGQTRAWLRKRRTRTEV